MRRRIQDPNLPGSCTLTERMDRETPFDCAPKMGGGSGMYTALMAKRATPHEALRKFRWPSMSQPSHPRVLQLPGSSPCPHLSDEPAVRLPGSFTDPWSPYLPLPVTTLPGRTHLLMNDDEGLLLSFPLLLPLPFFLMKLMSSCWMLLVLPGRDACWM